LVLTGRPGLLPPRLAVASAGGGVDHPVPGEALGHAVDPEGASGLGRPALPVDLQLARRPEPASGGRRPLRRPVALSKGVLLADEVGLGKTIEAGLVIAQRWAERRRRILVIVPATLRKQWAQEIDEKFGMPATVLEASSFNRLSKAGSANPFEVDDHVVICSYHFAANKSEQVARVPWDLVVIDESHRLRNVYKTGNKMARTLRDALRSPTKLLLTATPLQNTLMELFGIVSFIDEHVFGDEPSFRDQFLRSDNEDLRNLDLRRRLAPLCHRTLRRQVLEYIRFTKRIPITWDFFPTDEEQRLYQDVSDYLQRDELFALPSAQRMLMTMVLRKLLASSSFAIAGTLRTLVRRLEKQLANAKADSPEDEDAIAADFDTLPETREEWGDDEASATPSAATANACRPRSRP
jgi:SNF2 family DNA or RNA helicase